MTETGTVHSFVQDSPHLVPQYSALLQQARLWIEQETTERLGFYSAQEEEVPPAPAKKASPKPKRVTVGQLSEQVSSLATLLPGLIDQMKSVIERQDRLEAGAVPQPHPSPPAPKPPHQQSFVTPKGPGLPMPKVTALTGPPPRTRPPEVQTPALATGVAGAAPDVDPAFGQPPSPVASLAAPQDAMQAALLQQSQALSTLVGHLVSQQDGGLADLSSTPGSINLSAKGAAKREKLQAALASRSGDFFLQVMQAAFKRLNPSAPCPASLGDLSGQVSMCHYLERFGGFGGQREAGYAMWCLAHIADCLIQQDIQGAQEFLALTLVAVDQSVIDHGRWDFAWILTLLEDPPAQLFHARPYSSNPRSRAFSPLSPVAWTTCALQYLKEIDLITTRRLESLGTGPKVAASNPQGEPSPETPQKPKRQPRYPRKPKADASPAK